MRWDRQRVENDLRLPGVGDGSVVRTFDAPEAMGINFHEVRARAAAGDEPALLERSTTAFLYTKDRKPLTFVHAFGELLLVEGDICNGLRQ